MMPIANPVNKDGNRDYSMAEWNSRLKNHGKIFMNSARQDFMTVMFGPGIPSTRKFSWNPIANDLLFTKKQRNVPDVYNKSHGSKRIYQANLYFERSWDHDHFVFQLHFATLGIFFEVGHHSAKTGSYLIYISWFACISWSIFWDPNDNWHVFCVVNGSSEWIMKLHKGQRCVSCSSLQPIKKRVSIFRVFNKRRQWVIPNSELGCHGKWSHPWVSRRKRFQGVCCFHKQIAEAITLFQIPSRLEHSSKNQEDAVAHC